MSEELGSEKLTPLPPVSVDILLGKELDYIDVDQEAIARHMLENGADPDSIGETGILFKKDKVSALLPNYAGVYKPSSGHITVGVRRTQATEDGVFGDDSKGATEDANNTLAHELKHRLDDIDGVFSYYQQNRKTKPTLPRVAALTVMASSGMSTALEGIGTHPPTTGIFAVSSLFLVGQTIANRRKRYEERPSEVRARKHAVENTDSFVTVRYKSHP